VLRRVCATQKVVLETNKLFDCASFRIYDHGRRLYILGSLKLEVANVFRCAGRHKRGLGIVESCRKEGVPIFEYSRKE
jgi:hypothetical protein